MGARDGLSASKRKAVLQTMCLPPGFPATPPHPFDLPTILYYALISIPLDRPVLTLSDSPVLLSIPQVGPGDQG